MINNEKGGSGKKWDSLLYSYYLRISVQSLSKTTQTLVKIMCPHGGLKLRLTQYTA
jgi:hypothetical protein